MVGSALTPALAAAGHDVMRMVRPGSRADGIQWDPVHGTIDRDRLEGVDGVVHLAAENIFTLWTPAKKRQIRESRERGTRVLATALASLQRRPAVLVCASATGFYGVRPASEPLDEDSSRGTGFLADVVDAWERAADPARAAGIRVVHTRFGLVLSPKGGTLKTLRPLFQVGLGGQAGAGDQMWSWVALDDVIAAIQFVLASPQISGPVNVVAPLPVTQKAFMRTLGRVLRRPSFFSVPEILFKAAGGDMARELVLSSARVLPRKLQGAGFRFGYPELESALRHLLADPR